MDQRKGNVLIAAALLFIVLTSITAGALYLWQTRRNQPSTPLPATPSLGECFVTGCNGELCLEEKLSQEMGTICVYKDEYTCLKKTRCERQADGRCGWTQTEEFKACLSQHSSANTLPAPTGETAGWKTYTNGKYGFEVKYNPDLDPTERAGSGETVGQFTFLQAISFGLGMNPLKSPFGFEIEVSKKGPADYREEIVGHVADKIDSERTIINVISWTKMAYKIFLTTDYVSVTKAVTNNRGYGYAVTASTADINQILATFKFLD